MSPYGSVELTIIGAVLIFTSSACFIFLGIRAMWRAERLPDAAAMQREMLHDIPALHSHRKLARQMAKRTQILSDHGKRLIGEMYGVPLDGLTARMVIDEFKQHGPLGTRSECRTYWERSSGKWERIE